VAKAYRGWGKKHIEDLDLGRTSLKKTLLEGIMDWKKSGSSRGKAGIVWGGGGSPWQAVTGTNGEKVCKSGR